MTDLREKEIADLLDSGKGYLLVKDLYNTEEVDCYREECEIFLRQSLRIWSRRRIYARINRPDMYDYVQPRTALPDGSTAPPGTKPSTYRIYQFLHNSHSESTREFISKTLAIRDAIESPWAETDQSYQAEREILQNYSIVTKYVEEDDGLPKHRDARPDAFRFPLLQAVVLLTQPGSDYEGGDLLLFNEEGEKVAVQADLGMSKGDVVFFNKSQSHEVLPWRRVAGGNSTRWSVIIGARAPIRGRYSDRYKKGALFQDYLLPMLNTFRRRGK